MTGFPVLSRDVTNQTLPGREYFNYSLPARVWLVTSLPGTGKSIIFFYSVPAPRDSNGLSEGPATNPSYGVQANGD
jgi:hypothetical protein